MIEAILIVVFVALIALGAFILGAIDAGGDADEEAQRQFDDHVRWLTGQDRRDDAGVTPQSLKSEKDDHLC